MFFVPTLRYGAYAPPPLPGAWRCIPSPINLDLNCSPPLFYVLCFVYAIPQLVTTALSPGYLASPLAPYRLKLALPGVKVVMVVRDPTDR